MNKLKAILGILFSDHYKLFTYRYGKNSNSDYITVDYIDEFESKRTIPIGLENYIKEYIRLIPINKKLNKNL